MPRSCRLASERAAWEPDPPGRVQRATFGLRGSEMLRTYDWDAGTGRLTAATTNLQTTSAGWADQSSAADTFYYAYDPAGLVTAAGDAQDGGASQLQCFSYDDLGQLSQAWTSTGGTTTTVTDPAPGGVGGCTDTAPSAPAVGGPAPYWESWTYNEAGDRTGETIYDTSGNTADNVTQALAYPAAGTGTGSRPADAPSQVVTTGPGGSVTTVPSYDGAGDTAAQASTVTGTAPVPVPPAASSVTYTPAGLVSSVTTAAGTSSFTYDADGTLLLQKDPSQSVLYLDGGAEELLKDSSGTVSGLRFYPAPDGSAVVRSSSGTISYEAAGPQGTATESVNASSMALTRRYYDPYGNPAGAVPASWPDNKGFAGQPSDPATGLGLLGARQYDPVTGTFLSPDPLFQPGTLAEGGYAYTGDDPATYADPSGQIAVGGGGSTCSTGTGYETVCGGSGTTSTGTSTGGSNGSPAPGNPDPGQHLLPVVNRAAYIYFMAGFKDPNPYAKGPILELDSLAIFCAYNSSDCPASLWRSAITDRLNINGAMLGIMGDGLSMIGRPGEELPDSEPRVVYEQLAAEQDLTQIAEEEGTTAPEAVGVGDTTPIYRVSPAARGTSELDNGLNPADFPRTNELDGAAHFGNEARVEDFAATHAESHGVGFRIDVPTSWLARPEIQVWEGMSTNQLEYVIPRELIGKLNQFSRSPWNPGG